MHVDFLLERFAAHADADAVIWRELSLMDKSAKGGGLGGAPPLPDHACAAAPTGVRRAGYGPIPHADIAAMVDRHTKIVCTTNVVEEMVGVTKN